jgi:hypothetical protein
MMEKVAIVVKKNWEVEPILHGMTSLELKPIRLPFPDPLNSPKKADNKMNSARAVFSFPDVLEVAVYCIQDLMYFNVPPKSGSAE